VELRVVDDDVDHGVPVGAADLQSLSGDLGRAAAGHAPLDSQGIEGDGPLWVRETHAVQASAQRRGNGGGQSADQDAVVDDVPEFPVQPQGDPATGQGVAWVTAGHREIGDVPSRLCRGHRRPWFG
jgi:hypothetical protein